MIQKNPKEFFKKLGAPIKKLQGDPIKIWGAIKHNMRFFFKNVKLLKMMCVAKRNTKQNKQ